MTADMLRHKNISARDCLFLYRYCRCLAVVRCNIRVGILIAILLDTFTLGSSYRIVLYLANVASNSSNVELQKSLRSLHAVFLSQHQHYPVFLLMTNKIEAISHHS
jgi:hypothetical protein